MYVIDNLTGQNDLSCKIFPCKTLTEGRHWPLTARYFKALFYYNLMVKLVGFWFIKQSTKLKIPYSTFQKFYVRLILKILNVILGEIVFKLLQNWDPELVDSTSASYQILEGNIRSAVSFLEEFIYFCSKIYWEPL